MSYALLLILGLIALAGLLSAAMWRFKRGVALRHALETYEDWTRESPAALRGLSEEEFRAAFMRAHGAQGYAAAAIALLAAVITTPVLLGILQGGWYLAWVAMGRGAAYEEGLLVWQFWMFFALIAVWAGIIAIAARIHHGRAPGSLREEVLRQSTGS